jgi:lipoprotein Spr
MSPADLNTSSRRFTESKGSSSATNRPNEGHNTKETKKPATSNPDTSRESRPVSPTASTNTTMASRTDLLLDIYKEWKGVPYKLGGSTKSGIDCSAFTQMAYKQAFTQEIGRNTSMQFKVGKAVQRNELVVGDLVLFKTGKNTRHIGIYIGNEQFLHASVTFGVSVADLNNPYWKRRYVGARRVL